MALVPRLVSALDVPIIAAGGIMTGSGVLAALSLGASAVQMGTAFLCTKESGAGATYQSQITGLKDLDVDLTTPTKAYSGKMARAINTAFIEHFETTEVPIPAYPLTNTLCGSLRKEASKKNETAVMSMWAGQGAPLISSSLSAEELLRNIRQELSLSLADLHRLNICNP
jgi:nitronate monooxygenase